MDIEQQTAAYLILYGYENIEAWGADSDYDLVDGEWFYEGNPVDLNTQIVHAIAAAEQASMDYEIFGVSL